MSRSNSSGGITLSCREFYHYYESLPPAWRTFLAHSNNNWCPREIYYAYRSGLPLYQAREMLARDSTNSHLSHMFKGYCSFHSKSNLTQEEVTRITSYFQPSN